MVKRANVCNQAVNLRLAKRTLERRHSALAIRNDLSQFCILLLLDCQRAKVWNVHALSNRGTGSILTVAHCAFCAERRTACGAVWTGVCLHDRNNEESKPN